MECVVYTIEQAAEHVGWTPEYLQHEIDAGRIPCVRLGRKTIRILKNVVHGPWPPPFVQQKDPPAPESVAIPEMTLEERYAALEAKYNELQAKHDHLLRRLAKRRKPLPAKQVECIAKRDGAQCRYCGKRVHTWTRTIDHILPLSRGGDSSDENLVVACRQCNTGKHTWLVDEIGMTLRPAADPHLDAIQQGYARGATPLPSMRRHGRR